MPRNYQRKVPERCVVTDEQLETAKELIAKGASKRKAASQVGLKESTLRTRLKLGKAAESMGSFSTFTKAQEEEIYQYIKKSDDLYYGITMISLRKLIYEYAEINKIPHRFNTSTKLAGRDWVYGFMKRFPELKRQPTITSNTRAIGINKAHVKFFFDNLETLYKTYNFVPSRIFIMEESGINTVPKKIPKVSMKGKKLLGKIVSTERLQTITLVCAMSVTGNFIPPAFIFPRKSMKGYLLNNAPDGSIGMVSDSGFINSELFIKYLCHFKDNVQPTKDNPVLLILDNHSSHISLAAINFCRDYNIHVLILPPYSNHKMQPLDRGFFEPLKVNLAYECDKWLSHHPDRGIGQTEVAQLVNEALKKTAILNDVASAFQVSGIWPIDANIFSEEDFTAPTVTPANIQQEPTAPTSREEPLMTSESQSTSPSLLSKENSSNTSLSELVTTASSEMCVPSTSQRPIFLTSIKSLPKATAQNGRKRGKQPIIATDSPFKSELENKKKEEEDILAKKKVRLDLKQTLQTKKTTKKTIKTANKTGRKKITEITENVFIDICPLR